MKIAIVHDFLNQRGGAERVVAVLHEMFPEAPIFTSIVDRAKPLARVGFGRYSAFLDAEIARPKKAF